MGTRKTPAKKAAAAKTPASAKAPRKTSGKSPGKAPGRGGEPPPEGTEDYEIVLFVSDRDRSADVDAMIKQLGLREVTIALAKAYVRP